MVELLVTSTLGMFGYDVLALRFPKFKIFADFVDDYAALLALEDSAGEPGAEDEFVAEVAEVEGFEFGLFPLVFGGLEF